MKTLKSIALASVLAGGITGLASANTLQIVHIAGAPAYRQDSIAVISAVVATYGANGGEIQSTAADPTNAPAEQWYIKGYSGTVDLEINATFTGSTAGVEAVASQNLALGQKFIADLSAPLTTLPTASNSASNAAATVYVPDLTLSDTFQATTPFNGTVGLRQSSATTLTSYTFSSLTGSQLAVEPYVWVGSPGLSSHVTNITTAQAQSLYRNGALPLSFFTGLNADENATVYALSRDPGSGSRLIAQAETGVGVTTSIKTYKPVVSSTAGHLDSLGSYVGSTISANGGLYPAGLITSTQIYDPNNGDTGYPKFGTADNTGLLAAITSTPPANQYFIAYFNPTDSAEAVAAGSGQLKWNGVAYSSTAVAEGNYTFWSYEFAYPATTLGGNQLSFFNALVAAWPNANLVSGIQLTGSNAPSTGFNVSRLVDGGPISPQ